MAAVQSVMTVLIAVIAVWIAFAQWHLARARLRMDLFDRRSAVINSLREIIGTAIESQTVANQALWKFGYDKVGTRWLFDHEIETYLAEVSLRLGILNADKQIRDMQPGTQQGFDAGAKIDETMFWLIEQIEQLDSRFGRFMLINEPFYTSIKSCFCPVRTNWRTKKCC